jgi:hypothetical protein
MKTAIVYTGGIVTQSGSATPYYLEAYFHLKPNAIVSPESVH